MGSGPTRRRRSLTPDKTTTYGARSTLRGIDADNSGFMMRVTLRQILSTPFVMHIRPIKDTAGNWVRRAEFPELDECFAVDLSPWTALDKLEEGLISYLVTCVAAGKTIDPPRPPRRMEDVGLHLDEAGFHALQPYLDIPIASLSEDSQFVMLTRATQARLTEERT